MGMPRAQEVRPHRVCHCMANEQSLKLRGERWAMKLPAVNCPELAFED